MCRFGTISDLSTHSTSRQRFSDLHFCCREAPTLLSFKTLIMTPPAKGFDNSLLLYGSLTSSAKLTTKNGQSEQNVDQVLYLSMEGQQCHNKHHSDTVPKKCVIFFYALFRSISKSSPGAVNYCRLCAKYLSQRKFPPSCRPNNAENGAEVNNHSCILKIIIKLIACQTLFDGINPLKMDKKCI